jgi:hypothetical protein
VQKITPPILNWRLGAGFYLANTFEFKTANRRIYADFAKRVEDLQSKTDLIDKYNHFLYNGDIHPRYDV